MTTDNQKYEITNQAHPHYPWLHRIRALKDVREGVKAGTLGGYVQSADNLSQDGAAWIADDAICCEDALVAGDACLTEEAIAKGMKAGDLVKKAAQVCGGNGGGRPDMAQAGGSDVAKINDAISKIKTMIA